MDQSSLILINISSTLIAAVVAYYFSQRRYTFERLHDKKLTSLEEIYGRIISIEKDLKKYVMTTGSMHGSDFLEQRKAEFKPILDKFFELQEYYWKKEIMLNESTVKTIQSFIEVSIGIVSKLNVSNISLATRDNDSSYQLWNEASEVMTVKLKQVKSELKKEFRDVIAS